MLEALNDMKLRTGDENRVDGNQPGHQRCLCRSIDQKTACLHDYLNEPMVHAMSLSKTSVVLRNLSDLIASPGGRKIPLVYSETLVAEENHESRRDG